MIERKFISGAVVADTSLGERQIRVIASDPTVDRVKDVMVPEGCILDDYLKNNIVLADHDPGKAIGNFDVAVKSGRVEGVVTFAPPGISAKADEYCGLYKSGVMKAVSVGFEPVDYEPLKDGGVRYTKWKLMELSCVAVPANPNAITIERSMNTSNKAASWKVGASRNLPVDKESSWDGSAAEKSVFDHANFDGESPNTSFARKAFLVYDASNPKLKGSYKLPFAKVVNGRLTAVAAGIRNAASRLSQTDIPTDVQKNARAVIDHYEAKMNDDGKSIASLSDEDIAGILIRLGPDRLKAIVVKAGRVLSQANLDHLNEIGKSLKAMQQGQKNIGEAHDTLLDLHKKAAGLHDYLHDQMLDQMDHGTSLGDHVKAMLDGAQESNSDDDNNDGTDPDDITDPDQADRELAAEVEARKRVTDVLELERAPTS